MGVDSWDRLSKMLGVRADQLDDALADETRARRQLSRRGLLAASAAALGGAMLPRAAWSFPAETNPTEEWMRLACERAHFELMFHCEQNIPLGAMVSVDGLGYAAPADPHGVIVGRMVGYDEQGFIRVAVGL